MNLSPDFLALLTAFASKRVRYLVIGGYAVGVHSRPRTTKDLDLWIEHDPINIVNTCAALAMFGMPANIVEDVRSAGLKDIVWVGKVPTRIDFLFSIPAVPSFEAAWLNRVCVMLGGIPVPVIGSSDLIANKRSVGRPQDKRDVKVIEKMSTRK